MPRTGDRLRDHALAVDGARFVGRSDERARLDRLLDPTTPERILVVHGPGGIGKSALLRELRRRAAPAGYAVAAVQGRELLAALDQLSALVPDDAAAPPLLVIDEADELGDGLAVTRELLLDLLPADGVVVFAGRTPPPRAWWTDDSAAICVELALGPLADADADALLVALGVAEPDRRRRIAAWAGGSPLALTVAATTDGDGTLTAAGGDRLLAHLAGHEIEGVDPAVLEVASLVWAADARLLAAALPGHSTRGAMTQLLGLSVTERVGHRARLHPLVAQTVQARLREQRPERHRALVRRVATHLRGRAVDGDDIALLELADLVQDPQVRSGAGRIASATHYADALRPGDLDQLASLSGLGDNGWWQALRAEFEAAPRFVTTVRRAGGRLAGIGMCAPPAALQRDRPADDALMTPLLEHLRGAPLEPGPTVVLVGSLDVETDPAASAEVVRVGNGSLITRSGVVSPRHLWVNTRRISPQVHAFMQSLGYRDLGDLTRVIDGEPVTSMAADFGPGGLAGLLHGVVMAETGGPEPGGARVDAERLLHGLRHFHDDAALAGAGVSGAAAVAAAERRRAEVRVAIDTAFGHSPRETQLRRVLELTYLDGRLGEQALLARLHLSRATYYRHLRAAREQLVA